MPHWTEADLRATRAARREYARKPGKRAKSRPGKPTGVKKASLPTVSEHAEQVAVLTWWNLWAPTKGLDVRLLMAIPNGGARHIAVAAKLKAEGVRAGVPDLFLALPSFYRIGGTCESGMAFAGMFLEMKALKGRLSPEQVAYHMLLRGQDYNVLTCYGAEEAIRAIKAYVQRARTDEVSENKRGVP